MLSSADHSGGLVVGNELAVVSVDVLYKPAAPDLMHRVAVCINVGQTQPAVLEGKELGRGVIGRGKAQCWCRRAVATPVRRPHVQAGLSQLPRDQCCPESR